MLRGVFSTISRTSRPIVSRSPSSSPFLPSLQSSSLISSSSSSYHRSFSSSSSPSPSSSSCSLSRFPGAKSSFVSTIDGATYPPTQPLPVYRVLDEKGHLLVSNYKISHSDTQLVDMYKQMVVLNVMDSIFYDAQRQGRISFYMQNYGEEAIQIGSAAALTMEDIIFGQYREAGVFLYRGFTLANFADQLFATQYDLGKGRQMPVHYGSKKLNFQTISSPLGTQIPQATGAGYALKMEAEIEKKQLQNVVVCYFGEGAASEGDFHSALNMAATLETPVIFFCRNNGYAISTPSSDQYRGDGIVSRGPGYGIKSFRVDGNDLLAVHEITAHAKSLATKNSVPILIEAMSYRVGHHSTSDDSTRYRSAEEINYWLENENPIARFRFFLESRKLWDSAQESELRKQARKDVLAELGRAERTKKPSSMQLFTDVYKELPKHLQEQQSALIAHLEKYKDKYGLDEYANEKDYKDPSPIENK